MSVSPAGGACLRLFRLRPCSTLGAFPTQHRQGTYSFVVSGTAGLNVGANPSHLDREFGVEVCVVCLFHLKSVRLASAHVPNSAGYTTSLPRSIARIRAENLHNRAR